MVAGLEQVAGGAEADAGADREAAAEALGDGDDVGARRRDGVVGEPRAGAAHAGLHLVEPEQRAVLVGDRAGGGEVALGRDDDAGLALDRLEQDAAVSSVTAAASASASPYGTKVTSPGSGSNGSR